MKNEHKMKNSFNKFLHFSWINSMFSSSQMVKSSDPLPASRSSSFVSCARLSISSDIEMDWVDVEEHSATSQNPLPTTNQFDRTLSSSSSSFRISFTMDELDFVIVNTSGPLLAPSASFPTPSLDHNVNASRTFASSSSFPSTSSSPVPSLSSNPSVVGSSSPPYSSSSAGPPSESSNSFSSSSSTLDHSVSSRNSTVSRSTSLSVSSSNQHSDDSASATAVPSMSGLSVTESTPTHHRSSRSRTIFIMHSSFKWQEILLAVSFTVPVGLLSTTFKEVDGILVPDVLFTSNPPLFYIFVILDAVAFTASVIGILIHALKKKKYLYCLSVLAFTSLVFAFAIYLWVLLPDFLRFIPYALLIAILLVLLYVSVKRYKRAVSPRLPQHQPLQRIVTVTAN